MTPEREAAIREILYHPTVDHSDVQQAPISVRDADDLLAEVDALRMSCLEKDSEIGIIEAGLERIEGVIAMNNELQDEVDALRAKLAGVCRVEHDYVDILDQDGTGTKCCHCCKPKPAGEGGGDGS